MDFVISAGYGHLAATPAPEAEAGDVDEADFCGLPVWYRTFGEK